MIEYCWRVIVVFTDNTVKIRKQFQYNCFYKTLQDLEILLLRDKTILNSFRQIKIRWHLILYVFMTTSCFFQQKLQSLGAGCRNSVNDRDSSDALLVVYYSQETSEAETYVCHTIADSVHSCIRLFICELFKDAIKNSWGHAVA
jgi:hypothetical protein